MTQSEAQLRLIIDANPVLAWSTRPDGIQLTISCCLGPCDLTNVVKVAGATHEVWLGNINRFEHYSALVEWVVESKAAGALAPLPESFERHRFNPFRETTHARSDE
jgi:hypothetical protein